MKRPPSVVTEWHWERAARECVDGLAAGEHNSIQATTEAQTWNAVDEGTADGMWVLNTRHHSFKTAIGAAINAALGKHGSPRTFR